MRLFHLVFLAVALAFVAAFGQATRDIIPTPETVRTLQFTAAALALMTLAAVIRAYAFKVGGLTFCRLGRLCFSFCITRT